MRVLASAARLRAIVALATQDDGAAVNLWQADQRSTALRDVDRMARRAMAAAASTADGLNLGRGRDRRACAAGQSRRWRRTALSAAATTHVP